MTYTPMKVVLEHKILAIASLLLHECQLNVQMIHIILSWIRTVRHVDVVSFLTTEHGDTVRGIAIMSLKLCTL
jgi:hypothetical protein